MTIEKVVDPAKQAAIQVANDEFGDSGIVSTPTEPTPSAPAGGDGQPSAPAVTGTEPAAPAVGSEPVSPDADPSGIPVDPLATPDPATPIDPAAPVDPAAATPDDPNAAPAVEPTTPADPAADPTTPVEPDDGTFTTLEDVPPAEPADPTLPVTDFNAVSERIGYEVETLDDMEALVNQLKTPEDPFVNVSPLIKQAIEFERNGGDAKQFMSALAVNVETLSDRQALYEQSLVNKPELAADPEYAQQKFNREYTTKYGILEDEKLDVDFDSPEDYTQYLQDRKFAKQELEHTSKAARDNIKASQEKVMSEAPSANQERAEKAQAQNDRYVTDSNEFVNNFEGIQIPIDKEGKTLYNVSLDEVSRPLFNGWVKEPATFLQHIGIPDDGSDVDVEALNAHMAITAMMATTGEKGFGATFYGKMTERLNKGTLEHELIHPAPTNTTPGAVPPQQVNELDETVEAFEELVAGSKPA
jgi:hypothetical protein